MIRLVHIVARDGACLNSRHDRTLLLFSGFRIKNRRGNLLKQETQRQRALTQRRREPRLERKNITC